MKVFHLNLIRIFGFVDKRNHYTTFWNLEERVSVAIQKGNATCVMGTKRMEVFFLMYVMYFLSLYFFLKKINLIMNRNKSIQIFI